MELQLISHNTAGCCMLDVAHSVIYKLRDAPTYQLMCLVWPWTCSVFQIFNKNDNERS